MAAYLKSSADYGLDAPATVRNLFVSGGICLAIWASAAVGLWPGVIVGIPIAMMVLPAGLALVATGAGMIWYSRIGKRRARERLLDSLTWTGAERVLDVGCGRGLMLIGAAKRLTTGRAIGIDIWQGEDLTGNSSEGTLHNARLEGVADRVEVQTSDMRQLSFADESFDVVVSCAALHNLYQADQRRQAVCEIARVLKPGGHAVISDIRHSREYLDAFAADNCQEVRRFTSFAKTFSLMLLTWGSLRPMSFTVKKGFESRQR
jgi:ubiquinone/menaquinone biosynthesis C-methylase UbiE